MDTELWENMSLLRMNNEYLGLLYVNGGPWPHTDRPFIPILGSKDTSTIGLLILLNKLFHLEILPWLSDAKNAPSRSLIGTSIIIPHIRVFFEYRRNLEKENPAWESRGSPDCTVSTRSAAVLGAPTGSPHTPRQPPENISFNKYFSLSDITM